MNHNNLVVKFSVENFGHNVAEIKKSIAPKKLLTVLKNDGYGYSLNKLLPVAIKNGADYIGITSNSELEIVQKYNQSIPVLRIRSFLPSELDFSLSCKNIHEMVGSKIAAETLSNTAKKIGIIAKYHLMVDTGMGREGVLYNDFETVQYILSLPNIEIVGLMTHMSASEELNNLENKLQYDRFKKVEQFLVDLGHDNLITHCSNTCGTLFFDFDCKMQRVGTGLHGSSYGMKTNLNLKSTIKIYSFLSDYKIVPKNWKIGYNGTYTTEKETLIGIIPAGYADGIPKHFQGNFYIDGQPCKVLGKISLNVTTIDLSNVKNPKLGQKVEFLGKNQKTNDLAKNGDLFFAWNFSKNY